MKNVAVIGIDSDGTDGPTEYAGAIADESTLPRAREAGIDLFACLKRHAVTPALCRLGDAIHTGATGTNVNDLKLMIIQ